MTGFSAWCLKGSFLFLLPMIAYSFSSTTGGVAEITGSKNNLKKYITDIDHMLESSKKLLQNPRSKLKYEEVASELNHLKNDIVSGAPFRGINGNAPDISVWNEDILSAVNENERNWNDAPKYVTEKYYFRRIIEACRFFETKFDRFSNQKEEDIVEALKDIDEATLALDNLMKAAKSSNFDQKETENLLKYAITTSLWANNDKEELSLNDLLVNDIPQVTNILRSLSVDKEKERVVDIVLDNAGYEFVADLMLGHVLITIGAATKVVFHMKAYPTSRFTATVNDCYSSLDYLLDEETKTSFQTDNLALECLRHIKAGRFVFREDCFWCQPLPLWNMPERIAEQFSQSSLVFIKGEMNYRRLLGDLEWRRRKGSKMSSLRKISSLRKPGPVANDFKSLTSYFPTPLCALRNIQSELGMRALSAENIQKAATLNPNWMTSGSWSIVQIGGPSPPSS